MNRVPTNMTLSHEGRRLLTKLGARLGISMTSVVELALRNLAKAEGIGQEFADPYVKDRRKE